MLWTGIGRARYGCGGAIVGTAKQILEKMNCYMDIGIRSFKLLGYPLIEEYELFGKYVLRIYRTKNYQFYEVERLIKLKLHH
jgi:alkanesulfonate monooxygenase